MEISSPTRRLGQPWLTRLLVGVLGILLVGDGSGATGTATQTLTAEIRPIAKLTVGGSVVLSPGAAKFSPFQATLPISYWVRSTPGGTGATITATVTSNFAPAGGPSVATGALTYTCSAATYGTACSGTRTAAFASTPVLTLPQSACTGGGGVCSPADLNTINLNFTLTDDPAYQTGSYSAVVTFTISAT